MDALWPTLFLLVFVGIPLWIYKRFIERPQPKYPRLRAAVAAAIARGAIPDRDYDFDELLRLYGRRPKRSPVAARRAVPNALGLPDEDEWLPPVSSAYDDDAPDEPHPRLGDDDGFSDDTDLFDAALDHSDAFTTFSHIPGEGFIE